MDYGDFLVHIFSQTARSYYDLERLWRGAESVDLRRWYYFRDPDSPSISHACC